MPCSSEMSATDSKRKSPLGSTMAAMMVRMDMLDKSEATGGAVGTAATAGSVGARGSAAASGSAAAPDSPGAAGAPPVKKSSKFPAGGAASFACAPVVVNPMTLPAKMIATHNVSDKAAATRPLRG